METCENCHYARNSIDKKRQCRRHAPIPMNAFEFKKASILRAIGWVMTVYATGLAPDKKDDDLYDEVTEAMCYASWPDVDVDDWCGEWKEKL